MIPVTAIIDLGSNSIRMSVYRISSDRKVREIKRVRETVRLSEGMGLENIITEKAMERTLETLSEFKAVAEKFLCSKIIAIATAAVRRAVNREDFLKRANQIGISFRVLSEEEEAYYGFLGVSSEIPFDSYVIIDVGGGSSEITLVKDRKMVNTKSIPFGSVVLTENFNEEIIYDFVMSKLQEVEFLKMAKNLNIVALGGTADIIAKSQEKKRFSRKLLNSFYEKVKNTPQKMRNTIKGIPADRGDIILAGATVIKALTDYIEAEEITACHAGIRTGILLEEMIK